MVGSKCRDFKNREVSNVNAPNVQYFEIYLVKSTVKDISFKGCYVLIYETCYSEYTQKNL